MAEKWLCVLVRLCLMYHLIFSSLLFKECLGPSDIVKGCSGSFCNADSCYKTYRDPQGGEIEIVCWNICVSNQARKDSRPQDFWAGLYAEPSHHPSGPGFQPQWLGLLFLGSSHFPQVMGLSTTVMTGSAIGYKPSKCHCWQIKGKCEISAP